MKKMTALLLIIVLSLTLPSAAFAKGPDKKDVDYVALGDSLAAGVTPYKQLAVGYPGYLVERMEQSQYTVNFENFAVPGDTSSQLLTVLQKGNVKQEISEAEFITIDIGGNDVLAALRTNPATVPAALESVGRNYQIALSTIDSLNPDVDVYVMEYYNPLPYAPAAQQPQLEAILDSLNEIIQSSAERNGDTYVPTEKVIAKNYQTYLPNPLDIHLSQAGYEIVAKQFWKSFDKSKND